MAEHHHQLSMHERTQVTDILHWTATGFLAVADESPYVVPVNFAYDASAGPNGWGDILIHSGEGRKSRALAKDARVCLAVLGESSFERGEGPCDDGFAYASVLVEGKAELLTGMPEREQALRMIVAKYDPEAVDSPFDEQVLDQTLVYSVTIEAVSFKQRPNRP
jgi:nitroimidazol reductase NimA-like FMN-containing flavoprotein (pyridoxamine 5'-phosphate oxidase superfamily)